MVPKNEQNNPAHCHKENEDFLFWWPGSQSTKIAQKDLAQGLEKDAQT